jgi:EmrB/QacA subfamily drug resistance transporter
MARKWWTLLTVCLGLLMLLVDLTIVNVALPSIANDLDASFSDLQWTIDACALSLAALLLVAGSLGDRIGHRNVFGGGLVVFTVASLLCGLATDSLFLNLSRAAQGIGGAAMFASSLALIAQEYKGRERGTAFGAFGATAGASLALGPLIGGALTSGISWRWVFFINVPIGALAVLFLLTKVAETPRRQIRPDWLGAAIYAAALFAIVFGLIRGNPDGWSSAKVVTALAGGTALLVLFVLIERVREQPMLEFALFRRPAFIGATLAAFAFGASLASIFLYITLYLQNVLGYSPFETGLRFLPLTLLILLAAPIAGRLTERVPLRLLLAVGSALIAVGLGLMTQVAADSRWTVLLPGFIIAGLGSGVFNPPRAAAAIATVPEEKVGVGSSVTTPRSRLVSRPASPHSAPSLRVASGPCSKVSWLRLHRSSARAERGSWIRQARATRRACRRCRRTCAPRSRTRSRSPSSTASTASSGSPLPSRSPERSSASCSSANAISNGRPTSRARTRTQPRRVSLLTATRFRPEARLAVEP